MSSRQERIEQVLRDALKPLLVEIEDESHQHSGGRAETHFKLLVVSESFVGMSRIDRQRKVNDLLAVEFTSGLHALTQRALTPEEWQKTGATAGFVSPGCLGGSKKEG